jgi:hypothetical protein
MEDLIRFATKFEFRFGSITVEKTSRSLDLWAIRCEGGLVLNADGDLEIEPSPSHRTEEFLSRTRFSRDRAIEMALTFAKSGAY